MRVLAVGYFGEGNAGDDLLLSVLARRVRSTLPHATLIATWGDVSPWPCPADRHLPRMLRDIEDELHHVDAVVIGPGGLLHNASLAGNYHHDRGLAYLDSVVHAAVAIGVPVSAIGIGLGPLTGRAAHRIAARILNACETVTTRDDASSVLARSLRKAPSGQVVDLAYSLRPAPSPARLADERVLGISLRPWQDEAATAQRVINVSDAVLALVREREVDTVIGIPLSVNPHPALSDVAALERLEVALAPSVPMAIIESQSLDDLVRSIAGVDLMIAMRLHGVIIAGSSGIPTVGLSYDHKVRDVAAPLGVPILSIDATGGEIQLACLDALSAPPRAARNDQTQRIEEQLISLGRSVSDSRTKRSSVGRFLDSLLVTIGR